MDAYDLAYDRAVRSPPGTQRQELLAIQDTVSVAGPLTGRQLWAGQPPTAAALSRPGSGAEQGAQDTGRRCPEDKDSVLPLPWLGRSRICGAQSEMKGPLSKPDSQLPAAEGVALTGPRRVQRSKPMSPARESVHPQAGISEDLPGALGSPSPGKPTGQAGPPTEAAASP